MLSVERYAVHIVVQQIDGLKHIAVYNRLPSVRTHILWKIPAPHPGTDKPIDLVAVGQLTRNGINLHSRGQTKTHPHPAQFEIRIQIVSLAVVCHEPNRQNRTGKGTQQGVALGSLLSAVIGIHLLYGDIPIQRIVVHHVRADAVHLKFNGDAREFFLVSTFMLMASPQS